MKGGLSFWIKPIFLLEYPLGLYVFIYLTIVNPSIVPDVTCLYTSSTT